MKLIQNLKPYFAGIFVGLGVMFVGFIFYNFSKNNFNPSSLVESAKKINFPKAYIVESGSMEPAIKTGSIVVSYPYRIYAVGDVITFASTPQSKNLVTHRVEARLYPEGITKDPVYLTSGDANEDFDKDNVLAGQVVGKAVLTFPYVGYIANFAKQPYGFILLVIVPATIIIYEELRTLLKEMLEIFKNLFSRIFSRRRHRNNPDVQTQNNPRGYFESEPRGSKLPKISAIVPIFGAALVFTGLASSFFSDIETSIGNLFQAGDWTPPVQIAQTLVINEVLYDTNCINADDKQFIELWNGSGTDVDLQDWSLRDGNGNTIQIVNSNTSLPSGKFALISKSQAGWGDTCFGPLLSDVVTANLGGQVDIDASGGSIKLLDDLLNVVDRVDYGTMSATTTGTNNSTERKILGQDSVTGDLYDDNDFEKRSPSTAGFAIPQNQDVVINEFVVDDGSSGQGDDWVEVFNKSGSTIDIGGWTLRDTTGIFHTFPSPTNVGSNGFVSTPLFNNRLNNGGDKIYLFNSGGVLMDGISYYLFVPAQTNSVGRYPDGNNTWNEITSPTMGSANNVGSTWP